MEPRVGWEKNNLLFEECVSHSIYSQERGLTVADYNREAAVACPRICMTPTRNEAWIIGLFMAAARTWADYVIIADQGSSDGTFEKLQGVPKVVPVNNELVVFDEAHRQNLLINKARTIGGKRILIALDADEALSANCRDSEEWEKIANAAPGTVLRFRWVNVLPGFERAWILPEPIPLGFVDDGSPHEAGRIHCRRIPWPKGAPVLDLEDIVVLHFQYVLPERVASKHRWYQTWEALNQPERGALRIYRQYHHMHGSWGRGEIQPMRKEWIEGYDRAGIDFRSLKAEPVMWWDREVLDLLREHGPERFRKTDIWDKDWNEFGASLGTDDMDLSDPRNLFEKACQYLLSKTQAHREIWSVRAFEKVLRMLGW